MSFAKITTWSAVCKTLGIDPKAKPDVSKIDKESGLSTTAFYEASKIADAINKMDPAEQGNWMYQLYFTKNKKGGLVFACAIYVSWGAVSFAGAAARLYFKSRSGGEHAAKHFLKVYENLRK